MRREPLRDDLTMADGQRVRSMQRADPFGGIDPSTVPTDDLLADQRQWARGQQALGLAGGPSTAVRQVAMAVPQVPTEVESVIVTAPRPATRTPAKPATVTGPLTGRPGAAAYLAGIVNAIAGGPNQTQLIDQFGFKGHVTRGSGRDVRADGKVKAIPLPVGASGTLEPPSGRAEITVSGVKGRGVSLPDRIRIYTTQSGELDFDLPGPIKVGPISIVPKGTHVIGTPDPPGRKR